RDGDKRDRVEIGIGHAGDKIGGAGTAGGHANTRPTAGPRVTFSGESSTLFVARQHRADSLRTRQRLVQFHARAARVGKDRVHALAFERRDEDVAPLHGWANFGAFGRRGFLRFNGCFAHTCGGMTVRAADMTTSRTRPIRARAVHLTLSLDPDHRSFLVVAGESRAKQKPTTVA